MEYPVSPIGVAPSKKRTFVMDPDVVSAMAVRVRLVGPTKTALAGGLPDKQWPPGLCADDFAGQLQVETHV